MASPRMAPGKTLIPGHINWVKDITTQVELNFSVFPVEKPFLRPPAAAIPTGALMNTRIVVIQPYFQVAFQVMSLILTLGQYLSGLSDQNR